MTITIFFLFKISDQFCKKNVGPYPGGQFNGHNFAFSLDTTKRFWFAKAGVYYILDGDKYRLKEITYNMRESNYFG